MSENRLIVEKHFCDSLSSIHLRYAESIAAAAAAFFVLRA